MQMKSILKEWRARLNEAVITAPVEETYQKIRDWATGIKMPAERLNLKTPPGVNPEEVVTAMFTDLEPKVSQIDKEGAVTKVIFDDVSLDVLAPYFDADWQSGGEVSTAEGSLISLTSFNPQDGKAVIRISGNLRDRKGNALLATVDPTTGEDNLPVPLNEQEGEHEELEIEFDTYDIDVSGDEVTWYFKVDGYEIEVPTIRGFDAEDVAWQLITKLEDDERFPGVDSDDEAQEAAVERQVDTRDFQVAAKEAEAEANEQAAQHFNYEGLKKDSPLLKLIKEELKKVLLTEAEPVAAWPAKGGKSLEVTMRDIMDRLQRVEVNNRVWNRLVELIKKSIAKKEVDGYAKLKGAIESMTSNAKYFKKGTKASAADAAAKGGGKGPRKRHNVIVRNGECVVKGKSLGDVSGAEATPADIAKCKARNARHGMKMNVRSCARSAAQTRACNALANKT
jgi:hypothetical protein